MSPKDKTSASTITVVDKNKKEISTMPLSTTTTSHNQHNINDNKVADDLQKSRKTVDDEDIHRTTTNSLNLNKSNSLLGNTSQTSLRSSSSSSSSTSTITSSTISNGQQQQQQKKRGVKDFRFGKSIGEGSFSTVYMAKDIHTNKEYASKWFFAF